jgi:hypothetical protein
MPYKIGFNTICTNNTIKRGVCIKEPLKNSWLISFCYMMAKYRGDVSPIALEPRGIHSAPNNLLNRMFECSAVQDVHKALPSMDSGAAAASVLPVH